MPRLRAHHLCGDEVDALRAIILARSTEQRMTFAAAIEELPNHPACSRETAEWIRERVSWYHRRGKRVEWPQSLRRAGRVTPDLSAKFRGRRALQMATPPVHRGGFWVDGEGRSQELVPYVLFESDDVSLNEPFRWRDPDSGLWMAGRQTLVTIDVASAAFLGATAVGRPKDAYRAEDIADHFLRTCELHGLPTAWRLEHGSWAGNFVAGIEVEGMTARWGALDALFRVVHTTGPRSKGLIEVRFSILQSFLAHTEGGATLGRRASEFEGTAKLMRRVGYDRRRADDDAVSDQAAVQRLWTIDRFADAACAAMERANNRPVERTWSPDPIIPAAALQAAGNNHRQIPQTERWRFAPAKMAATVRRGQIVIKLRSYRMPFRFAINGALGDLYLEDGYKVLVAFHPGRPEEGCAIGNRERGAKNYRGWAVGQIIHHAAPYLPLVPQIDLSTQSGAAGNGQARAVTSAVATEFRGIAAQMQAYQTSRAAALQAQAATPHRESAARDSHGNRVEQAGIRAALPDIAAIRRAEESEAEATVDRLAAFRSRSLIGSEEEREALRFG